MEPIQGPYRGEAMSLPGNDLLTAAENAQDIPTLATKLGQYLRRYLVPSVQTIGSNAAVGASGNIPSPQPPESINVTTAGELAQIVINHNAPIQKGVQYVTTIATNPQFTGGIVHDHGCSRCPPPVYLPTKDGSGNVHNYYFGTVAQYPGSPASAPTYFGGVSPVAVNMGGSTQMTLQAGTGSGTASNGNQPFTGLGKSQVRLQQTAKRSVNGS
jgi:hypothetical protein